MENDLLASIASDAESANEIMGQIARLLTAGEYAAASVRADYLQGRIKSMERTQKLIAKLERKTS